MNNTRGYPTGRTVSWSRQSRKSNLQGTILGDTEVKPVLTLADLGSDMVTEYPIYDNGMYFVVDDVADVQFVVLRWGADGLGNNHPVAKDIDKYEAIRIADHERELELKCDDRTT